MNYQDLLDTLYDTLFCIFPKTIIETLIFKYMVKANKHTYINSIICHTPIYNFHYNKRLELMSYNSGDSYKLIDYKTGIAHTGSLIDTKSFTSLFIKDYFDYIPHILYFNDNILITIQHENIRLYTLEDAKYILTNSYKNVLASNACIHNNHIYTIEHDDYEYNIVVYNIDSRQNNNFIKKSDTYESNDESLQLSVIDDMIYIYEEKTHSNDALHLYVHDINTLNRINSHKITCEIKKAILYQNKLYCCKLNTIYVYDIIYNTSDAIYSYKIRCDEDIYDDVMISNDVILLESEKSYVLYEMH